jgi:hypothetical protein
MVRSELLTISETSVHSHDAARYPGVETGARRCELATWGRDMGSCLSRMPAHRSLLTDQGIRQTNVCERASLIRRKHVWSMSYHVLQRMVYSPTFPPCHVVVLVIIASVNPTMESKKETPQQMLGRALGGQQDTVTTTSSPGLSARSSQPSSSFARGSTSPLLDYVRRSQVKALAERTSTRIRELQSGDEPDPKDVVTDEQDRLTMTIQGVPMFTGVTLRSSIYFQLTTLRISCNI